MGSDESAFCYFTKYEARKVSSESKTEEGGVADFVTAIDNEDIKHIT